MSQKYRLALVTGASRGIGAAIAHNLGLSGYQVIGTATTENGAATITASFQKQSIDGFGLCLDVTKPDSISKLIETITADYGAVNILVNNAGITRDNIIMRMKEEDWMAVIDTNLNAVFRLTKACVRPMIKQRWGRVVNISSVVGSRGNGGQCNYAAAKAGIAGFSRSLAKELGSRNITVNTVAPGFIDTDMTKDLPLDSREAMLAQIPLARLGSANEIAQVVEFLVSDAAAYITGETLHVNGGMYMA
ncbi:MAG: 3-oxoacyl-ACP reductase FabG [Porticoccaceae bacterium]|nr:3-oxoacyl-ACP reductase FabG [Porticoccaceae bacterium]